MRTRVVIGLLLTWQTADSFWFLGQLASGALDVQGMGRYLFYKVMFLALATVFLLRQLDARQDAARRGEVRELVEFDLTKQFVPFMAVGAPTGVLLALVYSGFGRTLVMPATSVLIEQAVLIVPYETFIFVFFLPKLLPDYLGVPSWLWASAYFGGFHYFAYQGDPLAMGVAIAFNIAWYLMYRAGERHSFLGIGAVMAMHFAINALALAAQGEIAGFWVLGPLAVVVPRDADVAACSFLLTIILCTLASLRRVPQVERCFREWLRPRTASASRTRATWPSAS